MTHDPKKIMNELESYYSSLYDGNSCANSDTISTFIREPNQIPKLPENLRNICKGKLAYGECYVQYVKDFPKAGAWFFRPGTHMKHKENERRRASEMSFAMFFRENFHKSKHEKMLIVQ